MRAPQPGQGRWCPPRVRRHHRSRMVTPVYITGQGKVGPPVLSVSRAGPTPSLPQPHGNTCIYYVMKSNVYRPPTASASSVSGKMQAVQQSASGKVQTVQTGKCKQCNQERKRESASKAAKGTNRSLMRETWYIHHVLPQQRQQQRQQQLCRWGNSQDVTANRAFCRSHFNTRFATSAAAAAAATMQQGGTTEDV